MDDLYRTLCAPSRAELKVLGSRFCAVAEPVESAGEAEERLREIRRELFDASHHCFAFRLGPEGERFRAQDGGEPSGSAGRPILAAIVRAELTDVLVVVSRYFGGKKLGIPGLSRAYSSAARAAIEKGEVREVYAMEVIEISFSHAQVSGVMHTIAKTGAHIGETRYDEDVHLRLEIRRSLAQSLRKELQEKTGGKVHFVPGS
jgi:uncharacterized YigZ family protein